MLTGELELLLVTGAGFRSDATVIRNDTYVPRESRDEPEEQMLHEIDVIKGITKNTHL